ncbi:MAG: ribonuclease H-like domain-containing protein [Chloroflexi bacterium]|nr:ribonuclease H-like domain-containing protein [Chloroflexota bacterium]
MIDHDPTLTRRLERFRAATRLAPRPAPRSPDSDELATRLALALDGEAVRTSEGIVVRCEAPAHPLAIDRERLAGLPGQPPPDVPLVCLDTETTGLATAAGTVAFLVGLGWWEGRDRFRQVQLLLPDHGDEPALLTAIAATIPASAWLVTYNGRSFDWPLLVARYRLARRQAPAHGGHVDLLPVVRRLFRHRMADARLRTAERSLLGINRVGDVDGWEIPGRYLGFLRGGSADELVDVVRHNDQDVRSLARLLMHLERHLGTDQEWGAAPPGDLAGLARAFSRERRLTEALSCLEAATDRPIHPQPSQQRSSSSTAADDSQWWRTGRPADFGGRPRQAVVASQALATARLDAPWTAERITIDRARVLRRLGRHREAAAAWTTLAAGPGRIAIVATIELAKIHEHALRDRPAATALTITGLGQIERRRRMGSYEPALEADLRRRLSRLSRTRPAPQRSRPTNGTRGSGDSPAQRTRTPSSSGSNEQAIVRRSPAKAFR